MSKPTSDPTWDSNGTNTTATLAGHKTDGYAVNEIPGSGELNYWMQSVGAWLNYVKTGAIYLPATAATIANATVNNWNPTGSGLADVGLLYITGSGASSKLTGLIAGIDGQTVWALNLGSADIQLSTLDSGSVAANQLAAHSIPNSSFIRWVAGGGILLRYDGSALKWLVIATSFTMEPWTNTFTVYGSAFTPLNPATGTPTYSLAFGFLQTPLNAIAPLAITEGRAITGIRVRVVDSAAGPTKLQAYLLSADGSGGATTIASSAVSSGAGAAQTLTITTATLIVPATFYFVSVATTTGTSESAVFGFEVDYV